MLDRLAWAACDRLAALPTFPALVICACLAAAVCVGLMETPLP